MPKIPKPDTSKCWLPKHRGKTWETIAREDPRYLLWLLEFDCPVNLTDEQYERIQFALEEEEGE